MGRQQQQDSSSRKGRNGKEAKLYSNRWDISNIRDKSNSSKNIISRMVDSSSRDNWKI